MKYAAKWVVGASAVFAMAVALEPSEATGGSDGLIPMPASARHHQVKHDPRVRETEFEGTSSNWSGYAALTSLTKPKGLVTDVKGTWVVPEAHPSDPATTTDYTYSSNWVGIDGYASGTVEQLGTESDWDATTGQGVYYAWFEMYPKRGYYITSVTVSPGDVITAEVKLTAKGTYLLTMRNANTGETFALSQKSASARNTSAEWVVEAPSGGGVLPLANFGTTSFSNCSATIDGHTGPISNSPFWVYDPIDMVSGGTTKAHTNALTNGGKDFTVDWQHE